MEYLWAPPSREALHGKTVWVVTDSDASIGADVAVEYSQYGANVVLVGPEYAALARIQRRRASPSWGTIIPVASNLSSYEECLALVTEAVVVSARKYPDILVLTHSHRSKSKVASGADWFSKTSSAEESSAQLANSLDERALSLIRLVTIALPHLLRKESIISVISSAIPKINTEETVRFGVSHGALIGFFKGLRADLENSKTIKRASIVVHEIGWVASEAEVLELTSPAYPETHRKVTWKSSSDAARVIVRTALARVEFVHEFPAFDALVARWVPKPLLDVVDWQPWPKSLK